MKTLNYLLILMAFFAISCTSGSSSETENNEEDNNTTETVEATAESLVGEWYNVTIDLVIKADPDSVLKVSEGQWEEIMNMKPIRTTYREDGTFESVYTNLEGEPLGSSAGTWSVSGNQLTMVERGEARVYTFNIKDGVASFEAEIDWNVDGVLDQYSGTQKRYVADN